MGELVILPSPAGESDGNTLGGLLDAKGIPRIQKEKISDGVTQNEILARETLKGVTKRVSV